MNRASISLITSLICISLLSAGCAFARSYTPVETSTGPRFVTKENSNLYKFGNQFVSYPDLYQYFSHFGCDEAAESIRTVRRTEKWTEGALFLFFATLPAAPFATGDVFVTWVGSYLLSVSAYLTVGRYWIRKNESKAVDQFNDCISKYPLNIYNEPFGSESK